eukprot:TRINITY_DN857_c0_g1_i8.p1 TRINITY_DN857_c0_g1~~TRINITY_DN857_c0_g1_i8.p1  ORF type:complete len:190 (+),score=6.06 TRINITY_DN857_c0_g1_i8:479-1048(+)
MHATSCLEDDILYSQAMWMVCIKRAVSKQQQLGCDPNKICEVHGNMHSVQCDICGTTSPFNYTLQFDHNNFKVHDLPKCLVCKSIVRPNVFLFQDQGWDTGKYREQDERLTRFVEEREELLVVEVGAGIMVPTVRYFSESIILSRFVKRGVLIRINPTYYPRWMCSVNGDYDYLESSNVPAFEDYLSRS